MVCTQMCKCDAHCTFRNVTMLTLLYMTMMKTMMTMRCCITFHTLEKVVTVCYLTLMMFMKTKMLTLCYICLPWKLIQCRQTAWVNKCE